MLWIQEHNKLLHLGRDQGGNGDFATSFSEKRQQKCQRKRVKIDEKHEVAYRLQPYNEPSTQSWRNTIHYRAPDRWIHTTPVKRRVEAGVGEHGSAVGEVLGTDGLPNIDTDGIDGLTDAFVRIIFEGTFWSVRQSPRSGHVLILRWKNLLSSRMLLAFFTKLFATALEPWIICGLEAPVFF